MFLQSQKYRTKPGGLPGFDPVLPGWMGVFLSFSAFLNLHFFVSQRHNYLFSLVKVKRMKGLKCDTGKAKGQTVSHSCHKLSHSCHNHVTTYCHKLI